ncbi:lysosomal acid lipase/cholesteryl ester hydrolase-like [Lycorma delicatula]|uniref:lysosomal acid lipase/cholesteryl ester hydrolase-like n=1 Tax=Lycorma delicatula TaxID=130591 RepID=UPI003F513F12
MHNLKLFFVYLIYFLTLNINLSDSNSLNWIKLLLDVDYTIHPHKTDPKYREKTEDVIREAGYVAERHEIKTEDGYWLTVHRIPRGKGQLPLANKPAVILQHGLLSSSAGWVLSGPKNGLGFALADEGYDVWMPNVRGNTYSKRHEFLNSVKEPPRFWNFSFHEMGYYDLPATIDYILSSTGQKQIYYIGHSMGTTISYVLMSTRPEYNKVIKACFSLAPIAFVDHIKSPLLRFLELTEPFLSNYLLDHDKYELLPQSNWLDFAHSHICNNSLTFRVCETFIGLITGFDFSELDKSTLDKILDHYPAGASLKTLIHYRQLMQDKSFHQYYYGLKENYIQYGTVKTPEYDFNNITAPVILFFGKNDWIAVREDVDNLFNKLPHIVGKIIIDYKNFNHLDFMFAKNINYLAFNTLINILNRYRDVGDVDSDFMKQYETI